MIDRANRLAHLTNANPDIFAKRFKEVVKEQGLNKNKLETDGVCQSESTLSYFRGDRLPNGRTLMYICSYLNVSADYLLGISDEKRTVW